MASTAASAAFPSSADTLRDAMSDLAAEVCLAHEANFPKDYAFHGQHLLFLGDEEGKDRSLFFGVPTTTTADGALPASAHLKWCPMISFSQPVSTAPLSLEEQLLRERMRATGRGITKYIYDAK